MVAKTGRGWKLAPCLVAMEAEADRIAPKRNRKADGSIGDAAHSARTSDHNPSNGWVCAIDLTHDRAGGFDAHARARLVVARHDHRIKYVISNGQVARAYPSRVTGKNRAVNRSEERNGHIPPWVWANYTGSNPHRHHAHFSIVNETAARDDRSPWWPSGPVAPPEDTMDPHAFVVLTYYSVLQRPPTLKDIANAVDHIRAHPGGERAGMNAYLTAVANSPEAKALHGTK